MTTGEFLSLLQSKGIKVWAQDGDLCYSAPVGELTEGASSELLKRKAEILAFFSKKPISPLPLLPVALEKHLPLSFGQERLWFLDQLEPGSAFYNVPAVFSIKGALQTAALERAIDEIIRRHEALRTVFVPLNGQAFQVVKPFVRQGLPIIDLRLIPQNEREGERQKLIREEFDHPFDLVKGPLFRATLLQADAEEHVLLVTMHHSVSDGWSIGVFVEELRALYDAFVLGRSSPLEQLPIQYGDFAVWQRQSLQGEALAVELSYWTRHLSGVPAAMSLPTDHLRPIAQSYRGARQSLMLPKDIADQLKILGRNEKATFFMTLLAAFKALLHHYTGRDDIVVGAPIASRNRIETERLIGFFVNTLILRTNLSGSPTFRELLGRVRRVALDAYAHQDVPFEKIVEVLQPDRDLSRTPLVQVMFQLKNLPGTTLTLSGLTIEECTLEQNTAKFDLSMQIEENRAGLACFLDYSTDLFEAPTIRRMLDHYQTLLKGIAADPDRRLADLPILTAAEKRQLLLEWNDTQRDYPKDKCVHEVFEAQVERTPEAVALIFEDEQLTYRELNSRANRLAHYLRELGVGPEVLVGVCMDRCLEVVVTLLGVMKAGGAYLPLDPAYPRARLAFMLQDARVQVLLTQDKLLPEIGVNTTVCLDRDWGEIAQRSGENPKNEAIAENLAYVIYTSGSTGEPKGVEIRHCGILRLLFGVDYVELNESQTFLQFAPLSFDASTFEIWGALLHGSRCVLFPERRATPEELGKVLDQYNVATLWLTSSLFNTVIDEAPSSLSQVRQLVVGGEALSVSHVERALSLLPSTQLVNAYGPTESTTFACCYQIPHHLGQSQASVSIGYPIANTKVYLLDQDLHPVPLGVPGELYIGGDGLARGYLNRPELTAEKFIAVPFGTEPGARVYKTGDLARYLPDGSIQFLGRIDDQVKIRGFRIEPGEIEHMLGEHPAVLQSIVVAKHEVPGDKRLVAFVVSKQTSIPTAAELRMYLRSKLPDYMIPSAFVILDTLPLSPNGKIDRKLLPDASERPGEEGEFVPPRTSTEKLLAEMWSQLLRVGRVSIQDNFFDLGGHSLLATRLISRIRETFQIEMPLRSIFELPTIAELAESVEAIRWATEQSRETKVQDVMGREHGEI